VSALQEDGALPTRYTVIEDIDTGDVFLAVLEPGRLSTYRRAGADDLVNAANALNQLLAQT
jgi:hypothetical protein